jgi:hypothetical protein
MLALIVLCIVYPLRCIYFVAELKYQNQIKKCSQQIGESRSAFDMTASLSKSSDSDGGKFVFHKHEFVKTLIRQRGLFSQKISVA